MPVPEVLGGVLGSLQSERGRLPVARQLVDDELAVRGVLLEVDDVQLGRQPAHLGELGDGDAVDLDRVVVPGEGVARESWQSAWHLLLTSLESGSYSRSEAPPENWAMRKTTNSAGLT